MGSLPSPNVALALRIQGQNRLENADSAIFSQINVQAHHWHQLFEARQPPDKSLKAAQVKEPLVPAALLRFLLCRSRIRRLLGA